MTILRVPSQRYAETPHATDLVDIVHIADANNHSYTVPAETSFVVVAPTTPVWMRKNAAAAAPAGDVTDGSGGRYIDRPTEMSVSPGNTLQFVRATAVTVDISIARYGT